MSVVEGPVKVLVGKDQSLYYGNEMEIALPDVLGFEPQLDEGLRGMGDIRRFVSEFAVFPGKWFFGIIFWQSADDAKKFDQLVFGDPQTVYSLPANTLTGEHASYVCRTCNVTADLVVSDSSRSYNTVERYDAFPTPPVPCPNCGELFKGVVFRVLGSRNVECHE